MAIPVYSDSVKDNPYKIRGSKPPQGGDGWKVNAEAGLRV